jgi:3,4-dihydroxy-9,10-secoandrosta-1,3,5(10)-triene-9,17-dione 4,5-dioxygenase
VQIRSLGYVRFDVTDVDAWVGFAQILGLSVAAHDGGRSAALRVDEWACRISLEHADSDGLHAAGWELRDLGTLEAAAAELDAAGVTFKELAEPELVARGIEAGIAFDDPSGNRLELFCSPRVSTHPPALADVSSFLTGEQGLGHVVLPAAEMEQTFRFYTQVLGFRHRDSMLVQPHNGAPYRMRFLGCNPRHHSVALTEATTPRGIRHLMVNARTVTDVGRAFDRCRSAGAELRTTIGQHSNDLMISFYVASPGGIEIEFAAQGQDVDDRIWNTRELTEFKIWGYEPLS